MPRRNEATLAASWWFCLFSSSAWWWRQLWSCCSSLWSTRSPMHLFSFRLSLLLTPREVSSPHPLCHQGERPEVGRLPGLTWLTEFHGHGHLAAPRPFFRIVSVQWSGLERGWKKGMLEPTQARGDPVLCLSLSSASLHHRNCREVTPSPFFLSGSGHFSTFFPSPYALH